jgi:hypothetical protein
MTRSAVFLEAVWKTFGQAAADSGGYRDHDYQIGGSRIRLRFATPDLIPLVTPAFAHLQVPPAGDPELTVYLGAGGSPSMPPVPWGKDNHDGRGNLWSFRCGASTFNCQLTTDAYHILDRTCNLAYYWSHRREKFSRIEGGSPLLPVLHWWMSDHGRQLAHAAAVGTSAGGALLAGPGGAGKSNSALACLDAGMDYVADDYCLLENGFVPFAHSLYCSAKLNSEDVERFPRFRVCLSSGEQKIPGRAIYYFHDGFSRKMSKGFPIKAILILQLAAGKRTSWQKTVPGKSFLTLAPSTIYQLPGGAAGSFRKLAELTRRLPCFILHLGRDAAEIARTIRALLAEL